MKEYSNPKTEADIKDICSSRPFIHFGLDASSLNLNTVSEKILY